jgi:MFS family permease
MSRYTERTGRLIVFLMIAGSGLATVAKGMSLTFLAIRLQRDFGLDPATIGALIGIGPLLGALAAPLAGSMSDRIGRRTVLIAALILIAAALAGLGLAGSIMAFAAAHVVAAVAGAVYEPVSRALMSDASPEKLRLKAFSWRYLAINVGWALGPMIGIGVGAASSSLFVAAGLMHAIFAIAVAVIVPSRAKSPETQAPALESANWRRLWSVLQDPRLLFFIGGGTLLLAVHGQWSVTLSQYLSSSEDGVRLFALLVTVNAATVVLTSTPARFLIERMGARDAMALGCILFLAGEVGFAASSAIEGLILSMILFTLGEVLVVPSEYMLVDGIANDGNRGSYFGAHSLASIGNFLGPMLGGVALGAFGGPTMFFLFAAFAAASAIMFLVGHALPPPTPIGRPSDRFDPNSSGGSLRRLGFGRLGLAVP